MTAIAWIRREMRIEDNTALIEAAKEHREVVPFYVIDEELFRKKELGYPRVKFWHDSLLELEEMFEDRGWDLVVRKGKPLEEIEKVVEEAGVDEVFYNTDYTPYARERDEKVEKELEIPVRGVKDLVMFEKEEITTNQNSPYKVYSYYRDKWFEREKPGPREVPEFQTPVIGSHEIPDLESLGFERPERLGWIWNPGRKGGSERLESFREKIGYYEKKRDYPAEDATSKLSPHLKFGTVSIREVFQAAEEARKGGADEEGVRTWEEELAWRDFYFQVLWNWPETVEEAFLQKYRGLEWNSKEEAKRRWKSWVEGRTGYPFIDAGMRQLERTGWMHNRLRMVVTSFACKDLWLDWQDVHDYFSRNFVDAEVSAMVGGIQWAYSIGTDAQPYFRVFNPWTQGEDYDPEGEFIREQVPELEEVPDEYIHRPYEMPEEVQKDSGCIIGEDYPEPIVDHQGQKDKAVEKFEELTN
ncbi:MAG: DNA photolyase family protein [Candidatus Nanohaloarchaeota archaeon QJJ-7]|nr:DNA photolyase family protein [Candidatus Nanohaloarchaeota archaeon QJJ-7]